MISALYELKEKDGNQEGAGGSGVGGWGIRCAAKIATVALSERPRKCIDFPELL